MNTGLSSRFPEDLRFDFGQYTSDELLHIMKMQMSAARFECCTQCNPEKALMSYFESIVHNEELANGRNTGTLMQKVRLLLVMMIYCGTVSVVRESLIQTIMF